MSQSAPQLNQEQLQEWVKEQFQRANKHLAEHGVLFDSVTTAESRYLAPVMAVWKIKSQEKRHFWVISGDVPCDFMPYENEKNARDALRRFSFQWQLKAQELADNAGSNKTNIEFANYLQQKAEVVYDICSQDKLWEKGPED